MSKPVEKSNTLGIEKICLFVFTTECSLLTLVRTVPVEVRGGGVRIQSRVN